MAVTADAERELAALAPNAVRPAGDADVIDGDAPALGGRARHRRIHGRRARLGVAPS